MGSPGQRALPAALFVVAAAISGFTILRGGAPFDEGIVVEASSRVARGQMPYVDFRWAYGPLQPLLLGGWADLAGQSLLWWRIVRVLCDAGVAVLVFTLARRGGSTPLALLGFLAAACAMAQPTSASPVAPAVLFALGAVALAGHGERGRPVLAGLLVAVTAAWRLDFAVYAGGACLAAVLAAQGRAGLSAALRLAGVATVAGLVIHLPFAVAVGPGALYDQLVGISLREGTGWRLPFPLPWDGPLKDVLQNALPALCVIGWVVCAAWVGLSARGRRTGTFALQVGLVVLGLGGLVYLRSRTDEFHVMPLLVTLSALIPTIAARQGTRALRLTATALVAILAVFAVHGVQTRATALLRPPELATIDLPVADGAKAPPREARAVAAMARAVKRLVPPGEPIYTVTRRSDLAPVNQPLVYVYADRPNAMDQEYELATSRAAQEELVDRLRRARPRVVVRWTSTDSTRREQNTRGRPTGVRLLDRYLRRAYRPQARYGDYEVLARRG